MDLKIADICYGSTTRSARNFVDISIRFFGYSLYIPIRAVG